MAYRPIDHIALRVPALVEAEAFYRDLFDAAVAFREARVAGEWRTLPHGAGYAEAARAGVSLELCFLQRDALVLALHAAETPRAAGGPLDHVALRMDPADLDRLRERASALGCRLLADRPDYLLIEDPYGVRWEAGPPDDGGDGPRCTGETTGGWIELPSQDRGGR